MKKLLLLLLVCCPWAAQAQIKTGTYDVIMARANSYGEDTNAINMLGKGLIIEVKEGESMLMSLNNYPLHYWIIDHADTTGSITSYECREVRNLQPAILLSDVEENSTRELKKTCYRLMIIWSKTYSENIYIVKR